MNKLITEWVEEMEVVFKKRLDPETYAMVMAEVETMALYAYKMGASDAKYARSEISGRDSRELGNSRNEQITTGV